MPSIYLDHNATTPLLPEVARAMAEAYEQGYANPASQHQAGRAARRVLEDCRGRIAALLGASTAGMDPDQVIFTSGGAESNNHALRAAVGDHPEGSHLVVSAIEHPSVAEVADQLQSRGAQVDRLPADASGRVQPDRLTPLLRRETRLVSVMLANNETGVMQPLRQVVQLCQPRNIAVHTDATQVAGKLPVGFHELGVTYMTIAAHKFHGPRGIGALLVRGGTPTTPLLWGQASAVRPGTPPIELAIGMRVALESWAARADQRAERLRALRDQLERAILAGDPRVVVIGADSPRLPHTACLAFTGLNRQALVMALDREGVACSTGSACASGSSQPSPALLAMALPQAQISGAVRFSLGATTEAAEIADASERILRVSKRLRESTEAAKARA